MDVLSRLPLHVVAPALQTLSYSPEPFPNTGVLKPTVWLQLNAHSVVACGCSLASHYWSLVGIISLRPIDIMSNHLVLRCAALSFMPLETYGWLS
eukprot:Em0011g398a